eukprot:Blabericola_migrator_1__2036@NODE_1556_length_4278_cov_20_573261_g1020_i0_p2_GENE_NODE_1556_length_4278_cov_20_573261_g1020_i0NODE_1556_length_4278_cov_20_573261_g1020_i0_p2_ORF_typecomplete_len224_score10_54rve/PF00665_26/1e20Integrase_H2C2/PF17921_1/1_2e07DDE_2/PF02914_15/0_024_NODE_1556_length_4278_cov_20_573261_g1020_i016772348
MKCWMNESLCTPNCFTSVLTHQLVHLQLTSVRMQDFLHLKNSNMQRLRNKSALHVSFRIMQASQGMYRRLREIVWWPYLLQDIVAYTQQCLTCQRRTPQARQHSAGILSTTDVNIRLAIDFVGPIHYQERVHYILTMQDTFTRFPQAIVLPRTTMDVVWEALYVNWITVFGCPYQIQSDNGPPFNSKVFTDRLADLGIEHKPVTKRSPQSNGLIETFHLYWFD